MIKSTLTELALAMAILAGFAWGLYHLGGASEREATQARQADIERQANAQYRAEVERGAKAAASYAQEFTGMQSRFQNLEGKFNELRQRVPLSIARVPVGSGLAASLPAVACAMGGSPSNTTVAADRAAQPVLTAGAVWMWNSALAGTDVPAGACGTDDTSESACAAGTDLGFEDAWANHHINAQRCAEDRLKHQRLIDYLKGRHER